MKSLLNTNIVYLLSLTSLFCSCDESVDNIVPNTETVSVGTIAWSGDVTSQQKEVILDLVNNMVKIDATQFFMGAQSKNYSRPNYFTGYTAGKDTIFNRNVAHLLDTITYNSVKTPYYQLYYSNGLAVNPVIEVSMPDFFIGKFEITQGQWDAVMNRRPTGTYCKVEALKGTAAWYKETGLGDKVAAYNISYEDAVEFCETLNKKTGLKFGLPTEAEWECAARGGKATRGYKYIGSDIYTDVAWCYSNSCAVGLDGENYGVHEGGQLKPNELGIYDMNGNVSEWVANSYYQYCYKDSINPQGTLPGDTLILRGGSWVQQKSIDFCPSNRKKFIRSSYSDQSFLDAIAFCGFRIVLR